jgi:glucose/arabinose dehydrogenase
MFKHTIRTALAAALAATALAQSVPPLMSRGVAVPGNNLFVTHVPGDFSRIFVVAQSGEIRIVRLPAMSVDATPFLTVPGVAFGGESGLLCMAFHPNYADNGHLYVYMNASGTTATPTLRRFTRDPLDPDRADPLSAQPVLTIGMGNGIHNGGWIGFGPDGLLYISTGERGASANARDLTDNLRGKILRIDVDADDFPADATRNFAIPAGNPYVGIEGDDEIYAFGFRNPWRCYIDAPTGRMYIGDVGAGREELNVLPIAQPGLDFGWPCQEGAVNSCPAGTTVTLPIAHYRNPPAPPLNISGNAVIGGEVYHGCALAGLSRRYFFGDLSGAVVSFLYDGELHDVRNHTAALSGGVYGWGHDAYGELYLAAPNRIAKVVAAVPIGHDCNTNGIPDACDIVSGAMTDADHDGIADECPNIADINGDGTVGLPDLAILLGAFGSCAGDAGYVAAADFNGDGCNDLAELSALLARFGQ